VVQLVGLDHFELAKELLKNKLKIVWVTKLKQAQNEEEVSLGEAVSTLGPCCCVADARARVHVCGMRHYACCAVSCGGCQHAMLLSLE
jgi:hypothetical protein